MAIVNGMFSKRLEYCEIILGTFYKWLKIKTQNTCKSSSKSVFFVNRLFNLYYEEVDVITVAGRVVMPII